MKETKFRAWDGNKMIYDGDRVYPDHFSSMLKKVSTPVKVFHDRVELWVKETQLTDSSFDHPSWIPAKEFMEYTGLKDYTTIEQEIYEGDILLCSEHQEHLEVFYSDGAYRVQFSFEDESTVLTEKIIKANWLKKVGNIYENEDLI